MDIVRRSWIAFIFLFGVAQVAWSAPPARVNYQGLLTNTSDQAMAGPVNLSIRIFDSATGGSPLYSEDHTGVPLVYGVFDILIGSGSSTVGTFDANLFNSSLPRYVEVVVDGTTLGPRQPFSSVAYALQAQESIHADLAGTATSASTAGDADTVDGQHAADFAALYHSHDGAEITTGIVADARIDPTLARNTEVMPMVLSNDGSGSTLDADLLDGQDSTTFGSAAQVSMNQSDIAALQAAVSALQSTVSAQTATISALQAKLQYVTVNGTEMHITGANLHIESGTGSTNGSINGLGNLIIGYNELRGTGDDRTGSHNLILGSFQNYSSYGGLAAGSNNTLSNIFATVSGGQFNTASGSYSSVSAGVGNTASGSYSSVSAGVGNTASGAFSSVSGGATNLASGNSSSVAGGGGTNANDGNIAFADFSAILGGRNNLAGDGYRFYDVGTGKRIIIIGTDHTVGHHSTVSGGQINIVGGIFSSVSGGYTNTASGDSSSVSGGQWNSASFAYASVSGGYYNTASGISASVSGGIDNTASGSHSSVSGGIDNTAFAEESSILGGRENQTGAGNCSYNAVQQTTICTGTDHTVGPYSAVAGGFSNKAEGEYSSVGGGFRNDAKGASSSVSGGDTVQATLTNQWKAGTYSSP